MSSFALQDTLLFFQKQQKIRHSVYTVNKNSIKINQKRILEKSLHAYNSNSTGVETSSAFSRIIAKNNEWITRKLSGDPHYFTRHVSGQEPEFLWISCSDSRVLPNAMTQQGPGEIFTHRNVGNIVNLTDMNCMSAIEYAVLHLRVKHIVVCGHYGCGAVKASFGLPLSPTGILGAWISPIAEVRKKFLDELSRLPDDQKIDKLCELNAIQQAMKVCNSFPVVSAWEAGQELTVHAMIYSLENGSLTPLMTQTLPLTKFLMKHY